MGKLRKKDIAWLLFWLLVFVPIKPFFSERPYVAVRPPLTKGDIGSNHPQAHIYHGLSCGEDHMNATLARADVTRWLNPTIILASLAKMAVVAVIVVMVVYAFLMATFCCCHFGVHWAISGRYIRPRLDKRSTIQVLISGCGKTEMVTVRTDSPGKELYRALKKRSLLKHQHILSHGVSIIRTGLSIRQQGIGHLSTVFVLPVMGNGGGGTRLDQKPTMSELTALPGRTRHINILEGIGAKWDMVGATLLDDRDGAIIEAIARQYGNNAELINQKIMRRWLQERGIPNPTWRGLLGVLRMHQRAALAESIEEALTGEEAVAMTLSHTPSLPWQLVECLSNWFSLSSWFRTQPERSPSPLPPPSLPSPHHPDTAQTASQPRQGTTQQQEAEQDDQPQHSPPPLRHCSPLQHFQEYLKSYYSHQMDPETTWPPSPSKVYINLAIIDREETSTKQLHQLMLETLYRGVDIILETKAPVKIEALMDTQPGTKLRCVLVEGAPGIGKTTLAWEICKRWAMGNFFNQYSLVLLLRLRNGQVQTAKTIKDVILLLPMEEYLKDIVQYLKRADVLIILEGLDELPKELLSRPSIFTRLLAGTELPNATILVTSRPSATAQLWKTWKERISKHVEITGFTEENITAYVASILSPQELSKFNTYISTAPSIKQMMYVPLHSGIVVELYRMCKDTDKSLPTSKTALYTQLVHTILARYLTKHPTYKNDEIDIDDFTDLPDDIRPLFRDLTELAYENVTRQQLIIKDEDKPIQHLGLMHAVVQQLPNKHKSQYTYTFLHLSIQEYLGAIYMSQMETSTQERLVESMFSEQHLRNMAMFLAAITKSKGNNWEIIKRITQSECKKEKDGTLTLSRYAIQMVFESEDVSLLDGHINYIYKLDKSSPLFDFTALGYCIATSSYKWKLQLGSLTKEMETTSGVDLLLHALHHHNSNRYTIESIECWYRDSEVVQRLLAGLPHHTLPLIETLLLGCLSTSHYHLHGIIRVPLPQCLPELVHKMGLCVLGLWHATAATLPDTLHALATAPTCTLEMLDLGGSQFSQTAMQALHYALLRHSKSMTELELFNCDITDEQACLLATALNGLPELRKVNLSSNLFGDEGAAAIATSLDRRPKLREVDLSATNVTIIGHKALENWGKNNTQVELRY